MAKGYKSIHYNQRSKNFDVWEINDDGESVHKKIGFDEIIYMRLPKGRTSDKHDIFGNPVKEVIVRDKQHVTSLKQMGSVLCESDLDKTVKFLHQNYDTGAALKANMKDFNIAYHDIEIASEDEFPHAHLAKYPINLISVKSSKTGKMYTFGTQDYKDKKDSPFIQNYYFNSDEGIMLTKFVEWFRKSKFDIITGWNSSRFDIPYIVNRLRNLGLDEVAERLSPLNKIITRGKGKDETFNFPGLIHLDYLDLFKNFTFETQPSYSLQAIGSRYINEGKLELDGSINHIYKTNWEQFTDYNIQDVILVEKIDQKFKFIELAINYAYKALIPIDRVFSSIAVIEGNLLRYMHKQNKVMPDLPHYEKDWWYEDKMYLAKDSQGNLEKQNWNPTEKVGIEPFYVKGGIVIAHPGYYENCMSFDITSEYPHMIMQYNISPETKVINPSEEEKKNLIKSEINGVYYKKHEDQEGVLSQFTKTTFDERAFFKKLMFICENHSKNTPVDEILRLNGISMDQYNSYMKVILKDFPDKDWALAEAFYDSSQHIAKILINSVYGVLINKYFHFYDVDNARAITRGGRVLIKYLGYNAEDWLKQSWHKIYTKHGFAPIKDPKPLKKMISVLFDTDSSYLCLDELKQQYAPDMELLEFSYKMEKCLEDFFEKILQIKADKKGMPQIIDFKREAIISQKIILAKKKYLIRMKQNEAKVFKDYKFKATGFEIKRSSTPVFSRKYLQDGVDNIFDHHDKDINTQFARDRWDEYADQPIDEIASIGSVQEYDKYAKSNEYYIKQKGVTFEKGVPARNKASILYNYVIKTRNFPLMPISNGTKIKYIHVKQNNPWRHDVIAWVGNWPKEFDGLFEIDRKTQFEKTFTRTLERVWEAIGWGDEIVLKKSKFKKKKRK